MLRNIHSWYEVARLSLDALRANKARGFLTALGIIIGIVGVSTTMTAANGLANSFRESVSALGSDVLYVSRTPWVMNGSFFEFRNRPNLSIKEADRLALSLTEARAVNPTVNTQRSIKYQAETLRGIDIIGTTDKHMLVSASVPESGRFLTSFEIVSKKWVCVIGSSIRERLFAGVDPLNKRLRIGRKQFRIIGVMEKQGSAGFFGGPDFDNQIMVPITTFVNAFGGANREINIAVKAPLGQSLEDYEFELTGAMRKLRRLAPTEKDDFSINTMDALVGMFNNVMGVVVMIGILVTGVSLFVGGIGVMNIMFVSVTDRTREIGIRKAIGAKKRTILAQFLLESCAICVFGGLVGLILAYGASNLIDRYVMPASVSPVIVTVAILVSLLVGILSGLIPALKASRLRPIDALRYE